MCKEGQQMIQVIRVLNKNTPVMFDSKSRFPTQVHYLDQAEGLPHTPVLWCVCHLVEIPPLDQITKLLGDVIHPLSQETEENASDFKDNRSKRESKDTAVISKEGRRFRNMKQALPSVNALKLSKSARK